MSFDRYVIDLASRVGVFQPLLRCYEGAGDRLVVPDVDDAIREYEGATDRGTVLFPMIPGYASWCYRACILAHAVRTRGYEPMLLRCGGAFDICPSETVDSHSTTDRELCAYYSRRIPERFGLDTVSVDSLADQPDESDVEAVVDTGTYRGTDLWPLVEASARKHLKRYTLEATDPEHRSAIEAFTDAAVRIHDACTQAFEERGVVAAVINEPAYVQGGVPLDVANEHGVPVHTQMLGYRDEHLIFGRGSNPTPLPQFTDPAVVRRHLSNPLDGEEREAIERIMDARMSGGSEVVQYSSLSDRSVSVGADLVVGAFTNLLWDASLTPEDAPYPNVYDWLEDTIERTANDEGVHLVIKVHPAESMMGTRESVVGWIDERYERLPESVTLLPPDTDVNTYELLSDIDVGIVYTSTVGLEMAYEGLPVVVAGDTHYRGFGFTHDPDDPAGYRELLGDLGGLSATEEGRERARRYAHLLFVRKHVPFPYFTRAEGVQGYRLLSVDHEDIVPGTEPFDTVVSGLVDDAEVLVS